VTRPPGALHDKPQPMEVLRKGDNPGSVEKTIVPPSPDDAKSATVSAKTQAGDLPEKSPDPKPREAVAEEKLERPERKLSPKEKAAAAKEEKKRKLEEERKRKEDEKKRREEDRREAEKRRHEEEAAARKAVADAKKAEAQRRAEAKAAGENSAEGSKRRGAAPANDEGEEAPKRRGAKANDEGDEAPKRRVVKPGDGARAEESKSARSGDSARSDEPAKSESDDQPKRRVVKPAETANADDSAKPAGDDQPKRKVVVPQDTPPVEPKEEAPQKKRVAHEETKAADGTVSRSGTLTLSTSVEVNIEIDGRPAGTTPWVVSVKKGSGKIKLFGPNIEYSVMLSYKVEDEGGVSLKIETDPWVIAKYNGLSLGKTPQSVKGATKHRFSLIRPGQHAPLVVSLLWNAKGE
jgi:hypothetical protein